MKMFFFISEQYLNVFVKCCNRSLNTFMYLSPMQRIERMIDTNRLECDSTRATETITWLVRRLKHETAIVRRLKHETAIIWI